MDYTARAMHQLAASIGRTHAAYTTLTDKLTGLRDKLGASYSKDFSSGCVRYLNSLLGWLQQSQRCAWQSDQRYRRRQLVLPGARTADPSGSRIYCLWDQLRSASIGMTSRKLRSRLRRCLRSASVWQADQDKAGKRNQLEESYKLATGTLTAQQDALQVQRTAVDRTDIRDAEADRYQPPFARYRRIDGY